MAVPTVPSAELAIETRALRKTYRRITGRRTVAVHGLDLAVPAGGVHGFLGPNGSGKTTTIRMLLGLISADSGTMEIFGRRVPRALPAVIGRIGAIVEQPKFYPHFTARQNLQLLSQSIGAPRSAVGEVLEAVNLTERSKDRYRSYSLGMKQRLAIAATLLKDPDLLVFDEPTNGLDPAGIREIRETMRSLGSRGKTVLVSSHILAEVEQVADTVSIIGRGQLLASGNMAELVAAHHAPVVTVGIADPPAALEALRAASVEARVEGDHLVVTGERDPAKITWVLANQGLYVRELTPQHQGLEQLFLELTAGQTPGMQADPTTTFPTTGAHAAPVAPADQDGAP